MTPKKYLFITTVCFAIKLHSLCIPQAGGGGGERIWGGKEKISEAGREDVTSKLFAS